MYFEIFLLVTIGLTLLGLVRSTERILEIRHMRREQGNNPKLYL